jgi:hypothetical protein
MERSNKPFGPSGETPWSGTRGWSHRGMPISRQSTRKSVVTHSCPRDVALSWEDGNAPPVIVPVVVV